ncbi:MAG: glycosyltransferase family 9 protein [Bacteroidetes bacterium]|nr:glycosyltransferase family 9 protein [Bacteroidota bacterium]
MRTGNQIWLDKYVARPMAVCMNYLVRIAGKLFRIDHNLDKDFKTIAICKFKGMGSILQSTPLLAALRNRFPNAEIMYVSSQANKSLLHEMKLIDSVVILDDSGLIPLLRSCISGLFTLIKKRPDVYIDLEIYSDFSSLFAALSLSKNRFGFYLRSSSFRMGIYTHMMYFNTRVPVSQAYSQFASMLFAKDVDFGLYNFPHLSAKLNHYPQPYFVINPNASDLRLERRWPKTNFIDLINKLLEQFPDHHFLIIGSASEVDYTNQISSSIQNSRLQNTAGTLQLNELISLIKQATCMITNDTGPMHIALCTQTPVVCLFGPCAPIQYLFHAQAYPMYKPVYCSPCVHDFETAPCKGNNICMQLITIDEVINEVMKAMNKETKFVAANSTIYMNDNKSILGLVNR